jgi:DNA polymerase-3 subunit delta
MLIKHQALSTHLKRTTSLVYILIGQDTYLLNTSTELIKSHWKTKRDPDFTYLTVNQPADWNTLIEEAYSYSLFSDFSLIQASFDKKNLDSAGKNTLLNYAKKANDRCLIIIQAPLLTSKSLQTLSSIPAITIVQMVSLTGQAMKQWIAEALQNLNLNYSQDILELIQQYTSGNHLACAQVLTKLELVHQPGDTLTREDILVHLTDQCDYQLYELADACLTGSCAEAIHLTRKACDSKTEVTLILWLLTQEIRLLIQLQHQMSQDIPMNQAAAQLKIWPQRTSLYQAALKRLSQHTLLELLKMSQQLDEGFKTGKNKHVWQSVEQIILRLQ